MSKEGQSQEKVQKTGLLMGLVNLIVSPLYIVDSKMGLTVAIAANAAVLYQLHELGKSRRPGSNAINKIKTFFSSQTDTNSSEVNNAFRNIINGGAAVHDELTSFVPR